MTELFERPVTPPKGWLVLWELAGAYRWRIVLLAVLSFAGAMLEAGFLVILTALVLSLVSGHEVIGPLMGHNVPVIPALIFCWVALILRLALSLLSNQVAASLGAYVRTRQRRRVAHAFLRSSWSVQQAEPSGRLQELLTSFVGRINAAMLALTQAVTASLSLFGFMAAGVLIDAGATATVLGALALLGFFLVPLRRLIRRHAAYSTEADLRFATTTAELGTLGQEMRTFGVENRFEEQLDRVIVGATEGQRRMQVLTGALAPSYTFLAYSSVIGGVALMRWLGVGNLGAIGAVMLLMLRSLSYGQQLLSVAGLLAAAMPYLERVDEEVRRYTSQPAARGSTVPDAVTPLVFRDVEFAYQDGNAVLADINVTIPAGEILGVIGPSGAGKSTFAQLLLGLRSPTVGSVTVNGVQLTSVDRTWWTRHVAFVPQDPLLLTGTVAENILFLRDGLTAADLTRSARQANILDDIQRLSDGFDTHLGQRGSQLSGGQRQRMSIARALVSAPSLVVLDEPTSALDGHSEALIRDTLADLKGQVTIVLIAHRMSTLDLCDRIMVIEHGRVTGLAAPAELRRTSDFYRHALEVAGIAPSEPE